MSTTETYRPLLKIITDGLVVQIIQEAIDLLNNPGVQVHNLEALRLLADAGARVDFGSQVAFITEDLVQNALATTPEEFYLFNLKGEPVVHYGGNDVHFDPGSTAVTILSDQIGSQREPITADYIRFVKLVETLSSYDAQSTAFVCRDVPAEIGDLYRLYLSLITMHKPIITGSFGKESWWTMWEMLVSVAGSEQELSRQPIAVFDVCPTPPLLWSDLTVQNLIDCARKGIPAELVSMPLAGTTSPVTLAAAVVEHAAESLSGVVIHQLASPGAPIVWGGAPAAFDMRTGTTPMGDVNTWLIDCAYIQVGKHLNLPTHTYMGSSDAKILDAQSGIESAGGTLLAALSGANMVSGGGMIDFLRCQSFEKLLIDAEIIGMAKRLNAGIQTRDTPIARDLLRQSAHKANFLSHAHTHKWFRKELYIPTPLLDRGSLDAWRQSGSRSIVDRASEMVEERLSTYKPSPLSQELHAELRKITTLAAQQHGMQTLPPLSKEQTN
ncbi:MAG TPA: trimethylamine methyltransferase family protein [Anaerolineales bacterium]|nr:trimethylamine methyltransferase family protein [Anaerolineales bacterium]